MQTAAAYLRVSTERQDEYSLDSQLKLIRQYAMQHDMILPPEFIFVEDGVSGRSAANRKSFQTMIAYAKEEDHPFTVILVWKFSRFARNQEESIFYKAALSRSGVDVVSISETLDDSPFSSLIERIIEWMDEFYSIRLSGEVKRGMTERISRSEIVTMPSYGYDLSGKTYVPNEQAPIVRRIYADFLNGKGMNTIARELGAAGIRTRRGNLPDNRFVKYILQNPVYIGKLRWSNGGKNNYTRSKPSAENCILIDGTHEPLIDRVTFDAVQAKLDNMSRSPAFVRHDQPVEWMLKGLVRCSNCGATLVYAALSCPSMQCHNYSSGICHVSHSLSLAKANRTVAEALEACIANDTFPLAQLPPPVDPGTDIKRLITAEEQKLRRVQSAYEAGVDTLEEYAAKKKKLLASIEELKTRYSAVLSSARQSPTSAEMRRRTLDVLTIIRSDASESVKNQALRTVLSYIVYEKPSNKLALFFSF